MSEVTHTVSKSTVECYKIRFPKRSVWADITIDDNGKSGRIQIASDYGSWENYWGSCGSQFKQFLIDLSDDIHYTAGKFGAGRWFDHEATMKQLRIDLEEYDGDSETKRSMREQLNELADCDEYNTFCTLAYQSDHLHHLWDTGPSIVYDVTPSFRRFWEEIWPVFVAELKLEVVNAG